MLEAAFGAVVLFAIGIAVSGLFGATMRPLTKAQTEDLPRYLIVLDKIAWWLQLPLGFTMLLVPIGLAVRALFFD
jgi:hypothetical protein